MMRVVHLNHTTARGGAELALTRLVARFPRESSTVVVPADVPIGSFEGIRDRVIRLGPSNSSGAAGASLAEGFTMLLAVLRTAWSLRLSSTFRAATVVHCNSTRSILYGALATIGTRKVLVVHLRDRIDREALGAVGLALVSVALRRADAVIANSNSTLKAAAHRLPASAKVTVIPSPIGFAERRACRMEPGTEVSVGMVARLAPWKGQHLLLEAFAQAFPTGNTRLVFLGGAEFNESRYVEDLQSMATRLGIADRIEFAGHVADITAWLDQLTIAVQYSTRPEPMGQNVLQYLWFGVPTIAASEGGPTEWIVDGQNGLLVAPNSVASLRDALRHLAANPQLRARLSRGAFRTPRLLNDDESAAVHWAWLEKASRKQRLGLYGRLRGRTRWCLRR